MSKDAVYIAWGAPDQRVEDGKSKTPTETWIYERQLSVYAPMGMYSQAYPTPTLSGPRFSLEGFGRGGFSPVGVFYAPKTIRTGLLVKRAEFIDGSLHHTTSATGASGEGPSPPQGGHGSPGAKPLRK